MVPFSPASWAATSVAVSTTTARGTIPTAAGVTSGRVLRIWIAAGSPDVYVALGDGTIEATTAGVPIGAGETTFSINENVTHAAFITASGTASAKMTVGRGF